MENSLSPDLKTKIQTVFSSLNQGLVERDTVLKMALLTVLAGENILLIGPPGTAKSLIARRIANVLASTDNSSSYFEYLLTKFSTPDEIFGPLSIAALKADCVKRNTAGYLPTVRIAFLDEIFKASSSILNALLTILNERLYHNGAELQHVPMQALIAASNELPTGQDELSALYDRFLVRVFVDYVQLDNLPQLFAKTPEPIPFTPFSGEELAAINSAADEVIIPTQIVEAVQQIWQKHREMFKEDNREQLSDRRLKKIIKLLSVSAVTNGRTEVDLSDVLLLKDCLWNHYDNALKVREMIRGVLRNVSSTSHHLKLIKYVFTQEKQSTIKGYKGNGTKDDPILIRNIDDIIGLQGSVGKKGYYFCQIDDIDCSSLTTWPNIDFQGHYNGDGYIISGNNIDACVFNEIMPQSSIENVCLKNLCLATYANGCKITACTTIGSSLIKEATSCQIIACESERHLIENEFSKRTNYALQCEIVQCKSGYSLINEEASSCVIRDCLVILNQAWPKRRDRRPIFQPAGIASTLSSGCTVENCFVTGQFKEAQRHAFTNFSGIASNCCSSTIRSCAVGEIQTELYFNQRIATSEGQSILQNNIAINSIRGTSDSQGEDGKSISAALFTQHYFENHLGWDFENTWQWNNAENRPELQSVGVGAVVNGVKKASTNSTTGDLLTQQIRANMWL